MPQKHHCLSLAERSLARRERFDLSLASRCPCSGVNSDEKLPKSAEIKIPRVGNVMAAQASASLKFPRSRVLGNVVPPFCVIYRSSYWLLIWLGSSPCVFREEGFVFSGFAARSWETPALRFSRRR